MAGHFRVVVGGVKEVSLKLKKERFDGCLCDPPYGLSFMGKKWDYDVPSVETWTAVLAALKPGAHLLAFAGTRTQHRMAVRIEDAGFEIRDIIAWVYGSGFPKSHNLKGEFDGYGTALKPALEPITVARKPLRGTVAANCLEYGAGAINVDGCRIASEPWKAHRATGLGSVKFLAEGETPIIDKEPHTLGRWPANLIHDGSEEVLAGFPTSKDGVATNRNRNGVKPNSIYGKFAESGGEDVGYGGHGSAARFFYCAKASRSERGADNKHPTVKPVALAEYLARLILPPKRDTPRRLLVPFCGTGSEIIGALRAGWDEVLGVELSEEYVDIANARINHWLSRHEGARP